MINDQLLKILVCPESKQTLQLLDRLSLKKINEQILAKKIQNRAGEILEEPLTEALVTQDGSVLYPVRNEIPVLLIQESIELL